MAPRPYDWFLPIWIWIVLAVYLGLLAWLRAFVDTGDSGFTNVFTVVLSVPFLLIGIVWFLFISKFRRRTRFGSFGLVLLAVVLFIVLFEVENYTGSLVPSYRFRFAEPRALEGAGILAAERIDLLTTTADDFPGFLGPDRSTRIPGVELARDWERRPPELVWRQGVGAGWSGFAVVNGYAVTMEQRGESETVTAYSLDTGELQWVHARPVRFEHVLGGVGPRSTPLIDEGRVYALFTDGLLVCLDGGTGKMLWEKDLLAEYGVTPEQEFRNIQYGRSNSPLVVGDLLVVPAGGNPERPPASLAAYHKRTGEKIWEGGNRQISFSSPRLATVAGMEQILILNENTASGYNPETGEMLWEHPWPGVTAASATASQAVPVPPDRVFMSKGYGEGAALIRLVPRDDGTFKAQQLWHNHRTLRTKFTNVVIVDGHVYGLSEGILECVDLETGTRVWKRGRYGHGQILGVGDDLLVLAEDGEVVLIDLSPERPNDVLARFQAIEGQTWNNIALYGPYLAVRNAREAAVYKLPLAG